LKRFGCNENGECPNGDCDAGWKPTTCSQSIFKLFLLWNWTLWLIITNANQLTIIKPVSPPKISKTLDVQANDVQANDGHLVYQTDNTNIHTTDKH
jgi:hypothetical protein